MNIKISKSSLLVLAFIVFEMGLLQLPIWNSLDDKANDFWVNRQAQEQSVDDEIIIIEIDDKSLNVFEEEIGRWPWPRSVYGYLLEELKNFQPKAIIFDIMFSEKDLFRPDSDTYFNEVIDTIDNVYFASSLLSKQSGIAPIKVNKLPDSLKVLSHRGLTGDEKITIILPAVITKPNLKTALINYHGDDDGVSRYYHVTTKIGKQRLNSIPALVVEELYKSSPEIEKIRLNYKGIEQIPYKSISFIDAYELLTNSQGMDLITTFNNKIIIIGSSATGLHDLRETPVSVLQPAVSILATAIDNLKNDDYYRQLGDGYRLITVLISSLIIISWVFMKLKFNYFLNITLSLSIIICSGLFILSGYLSSQQLLFPFATPIVFIGLSFILINFYQGFTEHLGRQRATRIFGRFMDPRVVSTLIENDDWQTSLKSRSGRITVLFSDIRGFTSISESRDAEEVIDLLNHYFDTQVGAVFNHGGTLDKFIGDAIMAFWGAPLDDDMQALNAVKAAMEMSKNLELFIAQLPEDLQKFDIGIGIHTGSAVVGMLGSRKRYDYTAIGDTVNLASRIEGLTKGRARILVSETTMKSCGNALDFKFAGEFEVKGRKETVNLFEPLF